MIYAYVPIALPDFSDLLKKENLSEERLYLLLHQCFLSRLRKPNKKWSKKKRELFEAGYVSLDSRILKKLLTKNYTKYLDFAEDNSVINHYRNENTGNIIYFNGKVAQRLRITPELLHQNGTLRHFKKVPITGHKPLKVIRNVRALYKDRNETGEWHKLVTGTHEGISRNTRLIRFRIAEAEDFLNKKFRASKSVAKKQLLQTHLQTIEAINDGHIDYFKVDSFGNRFHSPITNVPSTLRKFMYFENFQEMPLVHIDLANSQVFLVALLLSKPALIKQLLPEFESCMTRIDEFSKCPDVIDFYQRSCDGNIYEYFVEASKPDTMSKIITPEKFKALRRAAKNKCISYLYSRIASDAATIPATDFRLFFKQHFPNVDKAITILKTTDFPAMREFYNENNKYVGEAKYYKSLSRIGQLTEARLVLGRISPRLLEKQLCFTTIHDSFITTSDRLAEVISIINEAFLALGVQPPKLKTTNYSTSGR